ncbi:caskin-2-like [Littorina saxatilis]|uniref:caskin-2-like n=1 Tax=Littorina saxatilis TaxID=31220 RepID=UPI0038B52845
MGKDHDLIQAVKDSDGTAIQKILQKLAKASKTKIIGNNKKLNINFQDGDGMSALHQASLMGSTDVIKLLLDSGSSPDLKDNKGMVALHYAAWQGRPDPVQALLLKHSPVNEQALNGETPLHLACQHGHIHVVKLLLTHHADPTICNKELKTPLDLACEFGRYKVAEQLLRSNLCEKILEDSPIDMLDNGRTTCLHLAAKNGHSDIIRLLIQNGMNINRATLNGTCLHEASLYGKTDVVKLLLDCGIDVNKPNSYDQTALDIVNKFTTSRAARELKQLLKEASFAVQARAVKDYFNSYDPQSLAFKEGDIITVLEQRGDGQWKGYVVQEGRMAKTGVFPANHVVLVDGQALKQQSKGPQVPDLLNRGPYFNHNGHLHHNGYGPPTTAGDSTSISSSSTDDSYPPPPYITNALGPPSSPAFTFGGGGPPPSPGGHHQHQNSYGVPHSPAHFQYSVPPSPAHGPNGVPHSPAHGPNGVSHSPAPVFHGVPHSPAHNAHGVPHSPAHNTHGVPHSPAHGFGVHPPHSPGPHSYGVAPPASPGYHPGGVHPPHSPGLGYGYLPGFPVTGHKDIQDSNLSNQGTPTFGSQHLQYLGGKPASTVVLPGGEQHGGEWAGPLGVGPVGAGPAAGGDMRAHSPGKEQQQHVQHNHSPAHSNRNSAASSDSGRGVSTGHLEPKVVTVTGQHRLSGQSYESGVSSRQSYHSTSSSSLGSLDRLEESGHTSTINVQQLIQASVPDKEVLHAWLHDLHFEEYYSNFMQAGYDMPTISRMTPEDLTAIGITKPAHRKRLKAEIARLHIHDGIPDFCPHDLIEWLHLLGLGMYHETLSGQGYDNIEYVTDITWEDLEEIGIKKLGHQKKIMLAIDRLKRITSASKRLSSIEHRRPSIEMLEPPPPAPPIGRWSGEISALPPHMYEGGLGVGGLGVGAKPKKSPSGDSISTTGSGGSGSSQGSGEVRAIPLPREDAGIAGGMPYSRQTSTSSASSDVVAIQVKRQGRSSVSEDTSKEVVGQAVVYQSFQGPVPGEYPVVTHPMSTSDPGVGVQAGIAAPKVQPKPKPMAKVVAKTKRTSRECSPDAEMEKHECENNSDGAKTAPAVLGTSSVAAVAAMMERSGEVYTGGTLKRKSGGSPATGQLRVETREHIYDQPQLSPKSAAAAVNAPASPKPQVMPKPASPLHVATHHNPAAQSSGSPTGRSKKAPPPPPKRTHSIRNDTAPPVVNKVEPNNTFTVTTTASVGAPSSPLPAKSNSSVKNVSHPTITPVKSVSHPTNTPVKSVSHPTNTPVKVVSHPPNTPASTTSTTAPTPAAVPAKPEPPVAEKPQTQAFASCVKSLSERFGSKKGEIEGSQESLSSDSDDFPPPPPPIAMDIITPKIHNYGIPSKTDIHHTPPSVRDYAMHGHHPPGPHNKDYGFQSRLKTLHATDPSALRSDQHALMASATPMKRISPGRDVPATSTAQSKGPEAPVVTSNLGDKRSESTTSFESTTSSSSTDSNTLPFANENVGTIKQRAAAVKPSIVQAFEGGDGQRSVDLNQELFDGSLRENSSMNVNRTKPSGANVEGTGAESKSSSNPHSAAGYQRTDCANSGSVGKRTVIGLKEKPVVLGIPQASQHPANKQSAVSRLAATAPSGSHTVASAASRLSATGPGNSRLSQQNHGASSEGPHRPPVPGKKPTLVPVPPQPQRQQQHHHQPQHPPQAQQHLQQQQQQQQHRPQPQAPSSSQQLQQAQQPAPHPQQKAVAPSVPSEAGEEVPRQSSDVLSDIDDMLQGLTDELDAMLQEETVG